MNHRVRAAGEHDVGLVAADDLDRLADRLAAGRTGGEAIDVRPLGVEEAGEVGGHHVRLLLDFGHRVEDFQALLREAGQVQGVSLGQGGDHHVRKVEEVLLSFAAAGVDAEAARVEPAQLDAGVGDRLFRRADGEMGVPPLVFPLRRVLADVGKVPIADFRGDLRGKVARVESRRLAHARLAGQEPLPDRFDFHAQGRDPSDAGDYDASSHGGSPSEARGRAAAA